MAYVGLIVAVIELDALVQPYRAVTVNALDERALTLTAVNTALSVLEETASMPTKAFQAPIPRRQKAGRPGSESLQAQRQKPYFACAELPV